MGGCGDGAAVLLGLEAYSHVTSHAVIPQVSRLVAEGLVQLRTVAAHPAATYPARLVAATAAEPFDVVVTSQTTYLHQVREMI